LRSGDHENNESNSYMNQAKTVIRKVGPNRVRSMELIGCCVAAMNKFFPPPGPAREAAIEAANGEKDSVY
jgi:hypothetical protein